MISDYLLGAAADSYGFDRASCRFITYGREKNKQMYTFDKNKKPYVLRIIKILPTVSDRRRLRWIGFCIWLKKA